MIRPINLDAWKRKFDDVVGRRTVCQRCLANEVRYRDFSDILNLEVCTSCAIKAVEVGIAVEALPRLRTDHQPSDVLNGDLPLNSAA